MSEWLGGAAPLGVFTSLELAHKEVKKWCANHEDEWEEHGLAGEYSHYVKVNKPYDGKRITLGFDITDNKDQPYSNLGLIPLI